MTGVPHGLARRLHEGAPVDRAMLDEVDWTRPPVVRETSGLRFAYRTNDADLDDYLDEVLADLRPTSADPWVDDGTELISVLEYDTDAGAAWAVCSDSERVFARQRRSWVAGTIMWLCNQAVIGSVHRERLALHAGAVAREGRAVVLAAPQEAGKTTLTTGLLRRGFDYLTDETAALDRDTLRLASYPKPLSLDRGSWPLFPELAPGPARLPFVADQWLVPGAAVGDGAVVDAADPVLLVAPHYRAGGTTRVREVGPAEMAVLLAESTFHLPEHAVDDLGAIARLVERCTYVGLEVADLETACDIVTDLLESAP